MPKLLVDYVKEYLGLPPFDKDNEHKLSLNLYFHLVDRWGERAVNEMIEKLEREVKNEV